MPATATTGKTAKRRTPLSRERVLRTACWTYLFATVASFVLKTPMGGNATRLAALAAGPLLACALWRRRPALLALLALPLIYWQAYPPARDWIRANDDPSIQRVYYGPLLQRLAREPGPFRIEIPLTKNHWEARWVASRYAMARGWERQLDVGRNKLFYDGKLNSVRYRHWLDENAVAYVAVPDVPFWVQFP